MNELYTTYSIVYAIISCIILVIFLLIDFVHITVEKNKLAYETFISQFQLRESLYYWEKKLIDEGYSVDYVNENANKYREEYLDSLGLCAEDINMSFIEYRKYIKRRNKTNII